MWGILAVIFGSVLLLVVAAAFVGWRRGWKSFALVAAALAGSMVVFAAVVALLLAAVIGLSAALSASPDFLYKSTFGKTPDQSVRDIKGETFGAFDNMGVYLKFSTTEENFRSLVLKDLRAKSDQNPCQGSQGSSGPEWWDFAAQNPDWIYFCREVDPRDSSASASFAYEWEVMAYDPKTKTAYYHYVGID